MCGVTGVFLLDGDHVAPATVRAMTDALVHRGADGEGLLVTVKKARFGLRPPPPCGYPTGRLPTVSQMSTPDGRFVLSYNGEVCDFRGLPSEFEAEDASFVSHGRLGGRPPCACPLGTGALSQLNGVFALALWDREEHRAPANK